MTDSLGKFMGTLAIGNTCKNDRAQENKAQPKVLAKAAFQAAKAKAKAGKPQKSPAEVLIAKVRNVHTHLNGEIKKLATMADKLDTSDSIAKGVSAKIKKCQADMHELAKRAVVFYAIVVTKKTSTKEFKDWLLDSAILFKQMKNAATQAQTC